MPMLALCLLAGNVHAEESMVTAQVASTAESAAAPETMAPKGAKTLRRTLDPVVVTGRQLPHTHNKLPAEFKLYRWSPAGGFKPIPYQFDERDQEDRYVFTSGPDSELYSDDGLIDANDELAFMAADSGAQVPLGDAGVNSVEAIEIELLDPVTDERGWVYLLPSTFSEEVSKTDYVSLKETDLEVTSSDYVFRFARPAPITFDYLAIRHAGEDLMNIVDRMKIRAWSRVLGLIRVDVNEEDLESELRGYIDGPVRVIRRSRNTFHIAIIPTLRTDLEAAFYRSHFDFDLTGKMPIDADTFVSSAEMRVSVDYNDNVRGATFYTGTYRKGYTFDGKPDGLPEMKELSRAPYQWGAIYGFGKDGSDGWFSRMIPGPTLPSWFQPFIEDDAERDDRPERVPGVNNIGFFSDTMKKMKKGPFSIRSYLFRLREFNPQDVTPYLNITDNPIEVKVRTLKVPANTPVLAEDVPAAKASGSDAPVKVVPTGSVQ